MTLSESRPVDISLALGFVEKLGRVKKGEGRFSSLTKTPQIFKRSCSQIAWANSSEGKRLKQQRGQRLPTLPLLGVTPSLLCHYLEAEVGIGPFRRDFRDKTSQFVELLKHYLVLTDHDSITTVC